MKKSILFILTLIITTGTSGTTKDGMERDPVLQKIEKELEDIIKQLGDEVSINFSESSKSLEIRYKARKFIVHSRMIIGGFSKETAPVINRRIVK